MISMEENWKITKYKEFKASTLGKVMNIKTGKILKGRIMRGYVYVHLRTPNYSKEVRLHRLIAETFIPNPDNLPIVNHKDENKENNCVDNLEWCNDTYSINYGTRNQKVSDKLINRKDISIPILQFTKDLVFITEYPSAAEAERQTGINKNDIGSCCKKRIHYNTAGGYIWKFKYPIALYRNFHKYHLLVYE